MSVGGASPGGVYLDDGGLAPVDPRVLADDCRVTRARSGRLPHHLSVVLRGIEADRVLPDLDRAGIAVSSGSACASLTLTPSATLRALGGAPDELDGPLCFTHGRFTAAADVEAVVRHVPRIVARQRALAPLPGR